MSRDLTRFVMLAAVAALLAAPDRGFAQNDKWGTVKGKIVWGGKDIPKRTPINVTVDKAHCLTANPTANICDGTILDESWLINPKNKGVKNVFVWIMNDPMMPLPIYPALVKFPKEVVMDQPACMFWPRAIAMREGQVLVVKNSSPVQHNIKWGGDPGGNVVIKEGGKHEIKNLKAARLPIILECSFHSWMKGRLAVFDHPYYAITDADGIFEIKDAPVGKHNIMIYHEVQGYRLGEESRNGEPITIKAGANDFGEKTIGK
jgi:hypothetical protein